MSEIYDVIVLGGGPGGYMAAELSGHAKLKTLCIEDKHLGGTCLNEGCIPTKTLLHSGKTYIHAKEGAMYGVTAKDVKIDHKAVVKRKDEVVKTLVNGVGMGLKAAKVTVVTGKGSVTGKSPEGYTVTDGKETYTTKNLIIATGSVCTILPIPGLDKALESGFAVTNKEVLEMAKLPKSLVVLGGGVIGLEMATYFAMVGVKVSVVEMLDHIAGPSDKDCTKILQKNLEAMGMEFILNAKVTEVLKDGVKYEKDGKTTTLKADNVLLSIGRRANTEGVGLENINVLTERGAVVTDEHMQTNQPGVYAVGDVNGKIMLAHTAYREADVAVNNILGKRDKMRYDAIPSVIYTVPEYASCGETEESAKAKGLDIKVVKLPMQYSGRYIAENEGGDGIAKLVFDKKYNKLIGACALANYSSEFIVAAASCIEMGLNVEDMKRIVFPHPTVCEIIREAVFKY